MPASLKKNRRSSTASHTLALVMIPLMIAVLLTTIACLIFTLSNQQESMETMIADTAKLIADEDEIVSLVTMETGTEEYYRIYAWVKETIDTMVATMSQIDVVSICDTDSIRHYHTNPEMVGYGFVGGDQYQILEGAEPYISQGTGTFGPQQRAFHAIYDAEGSIVGFVMVSVLNSKLRILRRQIILTFCLILVVMMLSGWIAISAFLNKLQRVLLGNSPEELAAKYLQRAEVLDVLDEGLFAIDADGRIILMNASAKKMLNLPPETQTEGHQLTEYYPQTKLPQTAKTGLTEHNINFVINGINIISSRMPVYDDGKLVGAASIFRDKTEVIEMAERLSGANTLVETLRTFNHEYMNKLHVILGMLEMNEVDQARDYILRTRLVSGQVVSDINHRVSDPALAALLIGKAVRASELGIRLTLKKDSFFYEKGRSLPSYQFITLVGNLLENAIYELNNTERPVKEIELGIYSEEGHTTIICDDTGGGIPDEILARIYERGVTTKGEGHGSGFAIMKDIVDEYHGTIHIDTEPDEGTSIEINLPI